MVWFWVGEGGVLWDWEGFFSREAMKLRIESNTIRFTSLFFAGITLPFPLFLDFSLRPPPPGLCLSATIASYHFLITSSLLFTYAGYWEKQQSQIYRGRKSQEGPLGSFPEASSLGLDFDGKLDWAKLCSHQILCKDVYW